MQYVRSFSGSVSKTWNSINPATLSGAIDVVVVEQEDGSLACSPFHVRFGKFSLLRPSEKKVRIKNQICLFGDISLTFGGNIKVEFKVGNIKQNYSMKLGDGGEAFFVFETSDDIPENLQTSPLISPATSPDSLLAQNPTAGTSLQEPEYLDLSADTIKRPSLAHIQSNGISMLSAEQKAHSDLGNITPLSMSPPQRPPRPKSGDWSPSSGSPPAALERYASEELLPICLRERARDDLPTDRASEPPQLSNAVVSATVEPRSSSPPPLSTDEAVSRAISLSKKLHGSNIPAHVTETGDLMLDMDGYKSSEEDALHAELIARKILSEELVGNYDIGALIGADEQGNLWIYSSEEAKEAAARKSEPSKMTSANIVNDTASDPGYHSDDERIVLDQKPPPQQEPTPREVPATGLVTPPQTPPETASAGDPNRFYAKTLRLTSNQLKALQLKSGPNLMSFSVNRATCQAYMYYWSYKVPVVISDIDGTITKSDALGHVLNMIGRDWTHIGVAKLYTDIVANGYNILYLTSRSVGQADTTRAYLHGVTQDGYKLPKGPVILSPDRTIAALRREVYLRKPEVFKMACLRDILNLFAPQRNPFYAGFGNRLTDALSYRSVNIPSTRIFTINSNAEVSLDLLTLTKYKSSYVTMREVVDHFFPPVGLLVAGGGENFTDFNYWREAPLEVDDFSDSDSEDAGLLGRGQRSLRSEDEGSDDDDDETGDDDIGEGYMSREDDARDLVDSILESIEDEELAQSLLLEGDQDPSATKTEETEMDVDEVESLEKDMDRNPLRKEKLLPKRGS